MASTVPRVSFYNIKRYAEENFGDEFCSLPGPRTVQVETVTKSYLPAARTLALRTTKRRRILLGHITTCNQPGVPTSKDVFGYLYSWGAGDSAPGICMDVDGALVPMENIASINFTGPFRHLAAPDGSQFSPMNVWALSTYYCMARDYKFYPVKTTHRELFLSYFMKACRLVHKGLTMSGPKPTPAQLQKNSLIVVLRMNPFVLRSFQRDGLETATRRFQMETIKTPTPCPVIPAQVSAKRPQTESEVLDNPDLSIVNPTAKRPRIDSSMTTPPLPDELDDETLKSIQHRLHKGQAAQAEAEEAKKHAATLLVERDILQVETETLKTENTILKTKITTAQEAFDRQRAESTAAELDKNTKLTAEVLDLKTSLEKERNATKIEAEAAQKEVNALTTQNNDLMSAKNALSKQVTALTTEKRELDNRVATLTIENNALGTENATLKGQVDKLEQEVKSAIRNLEVYKMRVRAIANEP